MSVKKYIKHIIEKNFYNNFGNKLNKCIKEYIKLYHEIEGLHNPELIQFEFSKNILQQVKEIRGLNNKPSIILNSIMPRSGSGYFSRLIRLHSDISVNPNELWEIPFMKTATGYFIEIMRDFLNSYKYNIGKISEYDFIPLFGASLIHFLYSFIPKGKHLFFINTNVFYLNYFWTLFPFEYMILLIRDGRDVVSSTYHTRHCNGEQFNKSSFINICKEWDYSAKMVMNFNSNYSTIYNDNYLIVKYENIVNDPKLLINKICDFLNLDSNRYDFKKIQDIGVIGSSGIKRNGQVTWERDEKKTTFFNPIGRWKEWTTKEKNIFKKIAGKSLIDIGYERNCNW